MEKICPRCKSRVRPNKRAYCRPCSTAHQAERRAGLHKRDRLCAACGSPFPGHGQSEICVPCRRSYSERVCTKCGEAFWAEGRKYWCSPCTNAHAREYHKDLKRRDSRRDQRFGLEPGGWMAIFEAQGGRCASCNDVLDPESRRVHTDHDRNCCGWQARSNSPLCGKCVRGILCGYCNVMLGQAKDDPARLQSGIDYLERWNALAVGRDENNCFR